jgi:hypothetical protein
MIGHESEGWETGTMRVSSDEAYSDYLEFCRIHHERHPGLKDAWSKAICERLVNCISDTKPTIAGHRVPCLIFRPLPECQEIFAKALRSPVSWGAGEQHTQGDRKCALLVADPSGLKEINQASPAMVQGGKYTYSRAHPTMGRL